MPFSGLRVREGRLDLTDTPDIACIILIVNFHHAIGSENMLEFLKRLADVDGIPRVKHSTSQDYFETVAREDSSNLCRWVGELYLELHRGTYTTHAKVITLFYARLVGLTLAL